MTRKTPKRFVRGNDRLARMLSEPGMREAVDEIHEGMQRLDKVYARQFTKRPR